MVAENAGATIWDLGDGCLCLEFHTKMNAVDNEIIAMQHKLVDLLEDGQYEAGIVANNAENFCVGANIMMNSVIFIITWKTASQKRNSVPATSCPRCVMK